MAITQEGTVLQIQGTNFHVKLTTVTDPLTNVKNTSGLDIQTGDKVIIDYVEDLTNPVIIGVYDDKIGNFVTKTEFNNSISSLNNSITNVSNRVQSGFIGINIPTAGTVVEGTVNFPIPFTSNPMVVVSALGNSSNMFANVSSRTTTQLTISATRTAAAGSIQVFWIAHGPV